MDEKNKCYQSWYDDQGKINKSDIYYCEKGYRVSTLDGDSPRGKCQHWEEYCMIRKQRMPRKDEGV